MQDRTGACRDIIVVGGSAGCIEVLARCVTELPAGLPAAVFVVVHVLPVAESRLPWLLARRSARPVRHARDGDAILRGHILVAPPDHHMVLHRDHVELNRGPTENSTRPAIDPLFRSAAAAFGPRVCGVVLSGNLDDGSAGLRRVVEEGGLTIVLDPDQAQHRDMPANAIASAGRCLVVPAEELAPALARVAECRNGAADRGPGRDAQAQGTSPGQPGGLDVRLGLAGAPTTTSPVIPSW